MVWVKLLAFCVFMCCSFAARLLGDNNDTLLHPYILYGEEVTYDSSAFIINNKRKIILSGSIHYPRSTPTMWPDLIGKAKDGGLNTIETYVFWSSHEPQYRQYDFTGRNDLVRFIKTIHEAGLYAILRIGPYVCAEWSYGGFPVWLHNIPDITMRTMNKPFQNEMEIFTTKIVDMMLRERLFASQGGPIILAQIENEYGNVEEDYHKAGVPWNIMKQYVDWCANLALSYNTGVPWIMCQQDNAPAPIISTCNGYYCDTWDPHKPNNPRFFTENWAGWFKNWGGQTPHRTPEDVAFSVARFFQYNGVGNNYYMYHGGTNFGRTAGGPYITTSYDYDAPLDEYGNPNQPKYGHLRRLHQVLMSVEDLLVREPRKHYEYGNSMTLTAVGEGGKQELCIFGNANETHEQAVYFRNTSYTIPAWSLSFYPDCKNEVYNTAKINTPYSEMVKLPEIPETLKWSWRKEKILHMEDDGTFNGSDFVIDRLLDQKFFNHTSDYLYYMTSVTRSNYTDYHLDENPILHVHTNGKVVHAFVNGRYVGKGVAEHNEDDFIYEQKVHLKNGVNSIVLISTLVGLQNYGAGFDTKRNGISGPVSLINSDDGHRVNISNFQWYYKARLEGERAKLFELGSHHGKWNTHLTAVDQGFIWYKAKFDTPIGTDPVVVDLNGMGKGVLYVNGHNLGRYWPSMTADESGCGVICDYRGTYDDKKCIYDCGYPSQRWYHVPRDYLNDNNLNEIVLFEEFGGNPMQVGIQTVTTGWVCVNGYEGELLELACQGGKTFSEIQFANFGDSIGKCTTFEVGKCGASGTLSVVQQACLGKESCSFQVSEATFGASGCDDKRNHRLAIQATCGGH